jgi:acetylornithine/succinyldiaminopimelate/putrescine aminotransferase
MDFLNKLLSEERGNNYELHDLINPQFVKVLKIIGFNKCYDKAEGMYLYDIDGNKYWDFLGGYGVFNIGRNQPFVKEVLKDYIDSDSASLIKMEAPLESGLLAKKLLALVPAKNLDNVFFTNSGTECVETAIKFAHATGRKKILYLEHAFHGLTNGSVAINGNKEFREGFEPYIPGCESIALNDITALEEKLSTKEFGAFIFEPIQGKGVYMPDPSFLTKAEELCNKTGTLFVADEIQTGLGRCGTMFCFEQYGLTPDMILISKALSAGFVPVGAVLTKRSVYEKVFTSLDRCVVHSTTFGQNNLACICGLATLEVFEKEELIPRAKAMGDYFIERLNTLKGTYEFVKDIRGKGLMIGIEFGPPEKLTLKMGWNLINKINEGLFAQVISMSLMRKYRILTQVSGHKVNIIKVLPPLIISKADIDYFVDSLDEILKESESFPGPIWEMGKSFLKI